MIDKKIHPVEMYRLINMLIEQKARFRVEELFGFPCVRFYNESGIEIGDAICHIGSYGHEDGLLEVLGLNIDKEKDGCCVKGWLTAEDVIDMLMDTVQKGKRNETV
jgi:hypothetical protein